MTPGQPRTFAYSGYGSMKDARGVRREIRLRQGSIGAERGFCPRRTRAELRMLVLAVCLISAPVWLGGGTVLLWSNGVDHEVVRVGAPISLGLVFVGLAVLMHAMTLGMRARAAELLRMKECPSCRYHLDDLEPDPDGCTICPECGAAWRVGQS